ncbi:MAG: GNAT family N-acetyltransferase [Faecousia sp.]
MKIERATAEDAAALLEIYAPYVEHTAISFEYAVPSVEEFQGRIRTISARYPYLKAVDGEGNILGYAYAAAFKSRAAYDWAVETTIYIRREHRGNGIGRALYEALERSLKGMGICNLNACIAYTPRPDGHLTNDSMHFHQKLGFHLVGTFHGCGYKFGTWYDMIWMEKIIGPHEENQPSVRFGEWTV